MIAKDKFSAEELNEYFNYDADSGKLFWKKLRPSAKTSIGKEAGTLHGKGYRIIRLRQKQMLAHRAVWIMNFGPIPKNMFIDHINGDKLDNRLSNLRIVSLEENNQNNASFKPKHNTSGLVGASYAKHMKKWMSTISVNNKSLRLGLFDTAEEAHFAYIEAKKKYHSGYVEAISS